jgi:hypothetical protein
LGAPDVAPPDDEPELLLGLLLGELALGGAPAPPEADPEAEPDGDFDGSVALDELDEPGVLELPLDGEVAEDELEPELAGGVALPLLLDEPLDLADLPASSPQAAKPKAIATAIANVESFMCPPWVG